MMRVATAVVVSFFFFPLLGVFSPSDSKSADRWLGRL
jgi:hypothetical protein